MGGSERSAIWLFVLFELFAVLPISSSNLLEKQGCTPSSPKSTTATKSTGKASLPSKNSGSCRSPWRNSQAVAYQTSSLEDLLPAPHYVSRPKVDVSKPFDVSMYWGPSISGTRKSLRFNKTTDFYPTSLLINSHCLKELPINSSKKTTSLLTAQVIFNFRNYYKEVPQAYFPANYKME